MVRRRCGRAEGRGSRGPLRAGLSDLQSVSLAAPQHVWILTGGGRFFAWRRYLEPPRGRAGGLMPAASDALAVAVPPRGARGGRLPCGEQSGIPPAPRALPTRAPPPR